MRRLNIAFLAIILCSMTLPTNSLAQVSPSPSPSSPAFIPFHILAEPHETPGPVLYVMAVGGDSATAKKVVANLAYQLQENRFLYIQETTNSAHALGLVTVVPEPQWGISDYVSACMSSADLAAAGNQETAGAMIVNLTAVSTYTIPHILYGRTNHTDLQGTLAYSRCIKPTPSPTPSGSPVPLTSTPTSWRYFTRDSKGKVSTVTTATLSTPSPPKKMLYYIGFQTTVQESDGKAQVFTALPIVGFLLAGISAWTQLTPSVTRSTTNVVTYPSPSPGAPIPPGGYVGQST